MAGTAPETRKPRIGDVYLVRFDGEGSEQQGWRPGVIFQNNVGNEFSPNCVVLPLTSAIKKSSQPTHVTLPADKTGLKKDSMVLCENPECMSKHRLGRYLTTLPDEYMAQIATGSLLSSSAISFIAPEALISIWKRAVKLNNQSVTRQ